jgi:ssDNA-binding Zn-finger/Zn-ribbon topoisomerase 1
MDNNTHETQARALEQCADETTEHLCPECGAPMVVSKISPAFCTWYVCPREQCDDSGAAP